MIIGRITSVEAPERQQVLDAMEAMVIDNKDVVFTLTGPAHFTPDIHAKQGKEGYLDFFVYGNHGEVQRILETLGFTHNLDTPLRVKPLKWTSSGSNWHLTPTIGSITMRHEEAKIDVILCNTKESYNAMRAVQNYFTESETFKTDVFQKDIRKLLFKVALDAYYMGYSDERFYGHE